MPNKYHDIPQAKRKINFVRYSGDLNKVVNRPTNDSKWTFSATKHTALWVQTPANTI
jgi:hypothetical protein